MGSAPTEMSSLLWLEMRKAEQIMLYYILFFRLARLESHNKRKRQTFVHTVHHFLKGARSSLSPSLQAFLHGRSNKPCIASSSSSVSCYTSQYELRIRLCTVEKTASYVPAFSAVFSVGLPAISCVQLCETVLVSIGHRRRLPFEHITQICRTHIHG